MMPSVYRCRGGDYGRISSKGTRICGLSVRNHPSAASCICPAVDPRTARLRIDDPDVAHAENEVARNARLHAAHTVFRAKTQPATLTPRLCHRVCYAASRSTMRVSTLTTWIDFARPTAFNAFTSSQLGSNSYHARPCRALVGCAW